MQIPKSIFEIKQIAKQIIRREPMSILKLGWAPLLLLMGLIYLAMQSLMQFSSQFSPNVTYNQVYTAMAKWLNNNPQVYLYVTEGRLAYFLVSIGVAFTCLDLIRQPKQAPHWDGAWQVFSGRYFLATIALWIIVFVLCRVGLLLTSFLGLLVMLFIRYSFLMSYFIYKDLTQKQSLTWRQTLQTLNLSWQLMRGHRMRLFFLDVSFWGWDLLNYFSMGAFNLYVAPYKAASYAVFYQDLINLNGNNLGVK